MIVYKDITALLFSFVFIYVAAIAQEPHYQEQTNYSPLANIKQVTGFAADKNNCIWLGTQAGIYRYDGSHFRHYNVLNTPVLKFERISEIFPTISQKGYGWYIQDAKGNLYTADSLSRIVPFKADSHNPEMSIYNLYGYFNLIPGKNYTLNEEFKDNIKAVHYLSSYRRIFLHLGSGTIRSMSVDDLYQSKKGDSLYSIGGNTSSRTFATDKKFYLAAGNNILCWKGMDQKPSIVALKGDINLQSKTLRFDSLVFYRITDPTIFLIGYKGRIYEANEINNGEALTTRLLIRDPSQKLPTQVYYSPSQRIILSYFSERGLAIYRPSRFSLLTLKGPDGFLPALDYYYSALPDGNGLITVNSKGIMRFGINGEKKILLEGTFSRFFLYKDKYDNTWHEDWRTRHIAYLPPGKKKSILVLPVQQGLSFCGAFQVNDSVYYLLGTRQLFKIVRKDHNFIPEILLDKTNTGEEFNVLYELDENTFWLGSDQGLEEFDIRNKTTKPVEALKNSYVRSIIRLEKDNYLVGTYDKGIFQYSDKQWTRVSSAKGRLPSSAHGFVVDNILQCVWVSSNDGLFRIPLNMLLRDKKGNNSNSKISFIKDFGPDISTEFNGSSNISAAKLADTCIVFANAKGLVIFDPSKLVGSPLPVRVLIESPIENTDPANKRSTADQLVFTPVVPYYGDAGDLEISYRLTGIDKDWHALSGGSIISYNNIKPGNHDLQFRINNFHSQDGPERLLTSHRIFVPARWYQTTWFKVLAIVLGIAIVIILHNVRTWYLKKRQKELEQMVKTKTSELRTANAQLSDTIEELKFSEADLKQSNYLKDEYFAVLTHDLRSPLRFLSFNTCMVLDMLPDIGSAQLKKSLIASYECTNDVSKLIDEFVYWIRNNENQLQAHPVPTMISPVIADVKKLYGFSLESNNNKLVTTFSPDLKFTIDPQMFFIVLRNAVDNANKYTSGGTITITAMQENDDLVVTVADTGSGIKEEMVQQLAQLQYEDVQFGHKKRKSLGFYIMAMLTKKMGGNYTIHSIIGQGTVLKFIIPEISANKKSQP